MILLIIFYLYKVITYVNIIGNQEFYNKKWYKHKIKEVKLKSCYSYMWTRNNLYY